MKIAFPHKLLVSLLALLVLVTTNSFAIEKHFCGERLIDTSVFAELEKCPGCLDAKDNIPSESECCTDVVDVLEGQDITTVKKIDDLDVDQQVFLVAFGKAFFSLFQPESKSPENSLYYDPPTISFDLQSCYQVYLI
ncbi:hypothetical protein [uncultured Christiangramia sp.]|uniref:HYC_CC_PP family protein n=1 Tax=uncultured Christiangramia sp. TaxID=503836 RepID=UPI0025E25063|nr:hypothetical protein [uncultured Christiangramia sp.]